MNDVSSVLSPMAQATLLLTSYFAKASSESAKPLTNTEWGRFAFWLHEHSLTPADLLQGDVQALLKGWQDSRIGVERIALLLGRGHSLALAMERWQRAGLWVVTRADSEYPLRLKQRLKANCPPVLFGCGNKALLNVGGLAVVGSRNVGEQDLAFTEQLGAKAASEGVAIVSGGARGVDEASMLGAARQGGVVIGVMADSLLRAATSAKWRAGLMQGNVVLVSPFYPEAGFSAGNAMARNKYIYCLADSSLVVHSGKKGGTLSGANENLKHGWVPLWVKPTEDTATANADLVARGGRWLSTPGQDLLVADLLVMKPSVESAARIAEQQNDLFAGLEPGLTPAVMENDVATTQDLFMGKLGEPGMEEVDEPEQISPAALDFYQIFISQLPVLAANPATLDELKAATRLHNSQLNDWLKQAVTDGLVIKLNRPVRYQAKIEE